MERLLRSNYSIISGPSGRDARREDLMLVKGQWNHNGERLLRSNYSIISGLIGRDAREEDQMLIRRWWNQNGKAAAANWEHIGCVELSIPTLDHIALNCMIWQLELCQPVESTGRAKYTNWFWNRAKYYFLGRAKWTNWSRVKLYWIFRAK